MLVRSDSKFLLEESADIIFCRSEFFCKQIQGDLGGVFRFYVIFDLCHGAVAAMRVADQFSENAVHQ